ncbi:hypothetical protein D3C80_1356110 [compost metagenome]
MASVIVRSNEAVKRIVVLVGQPVCKLIVLGVKPIGKGGADFINFCIRHLYGFHIPYLDLLVVNRNFFGNIRRGIDKGVFEQGNPVKRPAFSFDSVFFPYMQILTVALYGKVIGAFRVMNEYICIKKM